MTRSFAELEKDYLGIGVGASIATVYPVGANPNSFLQSGAVEKAKRKSDARRRAKKMGTPHFPFRIAPRRKNLLSQPPYFSKRVDS